MTPYEKAQLQFKGKNVLIFGLGLLGGALGDTRFFAGLGAHVRVTDTKTKQKLQSTLDALADIEFEMTLGGHSQDDIDWADVIVSNPSVPHEHELLQLARQKGKRIVMRTSLFVELAGIQTIGITGTRGKTTTTMIIYELAKQLSAKKVLLGGNVAGVSDLELLSQITDPAQTLVVLELSSWQLQGFKESQLSPHISVITNLYPDHLNRYKDLDEYYEDKHTIIKFQGESDHAVLNADQAECISWAKLAKSQIHWFQAASYPETSVLKIPGTHNRSNAAAALTVANILGFDQSKSLEIIENFSGVPYRLQVVAVKNDVTYINDTTSTTPIATITALKASTTKPILILGGSDKNLPITELADAVNRYAKAVIVLPGNGTNRIQPLINSKLIQGSTSSMQQAVNLAADIAAPFDIVLLSPGFTSFGLFNNEFHRGDEFNRCVQNLP